VSTITNSAGSLMKPAGPRVLVGAGEDDVGGELRSRQRRLEAGRAERLRSPAWPGEATAARPETSPDTQKATRRTPIAHDTAATATPERAIRECQSYVKMVPTET